MIRAVLGLISLAVVSIACGQGSFSSAAADVYLQQQDWKALAKYSRDWTFAAPGDAKAWYYLGTAYLVGLHRPEDAASPLLRATQLKPHWDVAWAALGIDNLDLHRLTEAAQAFEQTTSLAPTNPNHWNNLAAAYAAAHRADLAEGALDREQAQAVRWASNADWYALGNGYASIGRFEKAIEAYRHSLHLEEHVAEVWNNLGVAQESLGDLAEAQLSYRRAAGLGDDLGTQNLQRLQSIDLPIRTADAAQAHAWETSYPGQPYNPFGRPG
jgi:tetratricopeptide (TPR) repeat protein